MDVRCDISEQYVVESVMRRGKVQAGVKCNISGQKTRSREVHPGVKYDISFFFSAEDMILVVISVMRRPKVHTGEKSDISG